MPTGPECSKIYNGDKWVCTSDTIIVQRQRADGTMCYDIVDDCLDCPILLSGVRRRFLDAESGPLLPRHASQLSTCLIEIARQLKMCLYYPIELY